MNTCTGDGPLDPGQLDNIRKRLAKMTQGKLLHFYRACLQMCQVGPKGEPPRPPFIQQLVQAWREMWRRR